MKAVLSVDVGQSQDWTAIVLVEPQPDGSVHIPSAKRLPKRLGYVVQRDEILKTVAKLVDRAGPALDMILAIDRGQAGRAVEELLRADLHTVVGTSRVNIVGVEITSGSATSGSPRAQRMSISKTILKDPVAVLAARDELTFGRLEPLGRIPRALMAELLSLEILSEDSVTGRLRWGSPEGQFDDLALACLQGVFVATKLTGPGGGAEFISSRTATARLAGSSRW